MGTNWRRWRFWQPWWTRNALFSAARCSLVYGSTTAIPPGIDVPTAIYLGLHAWFLIPASAFPKLGQEVVRARKPAERRHPSALPAIPHMTFGPTTAGVMLKGKGDADGDVPTPYWGGTETRSVNRDLPTALRLGKSIWLLPMSLAFPRGGPAVPPKGASPTGRCAIPTATTLSPAQRDITLRNGNGFGIISDTKNNSA